MPRLSPIGDAVTGFAGTTLGINGSTPATFVGHQSGGWDWMSSTLLVGNADVGAGFHLYTYNTVGPVLTLVDTKGGNQTCGGSGVYAAFLTGAGVYWSIAGPLPAGFAQAYLADVSETGITLLVQNYQAGSGLQAYNASGSLLWTITPQLFPSLPPEPPVTIRGNTLAFRTVEGYNLYDAGTAQSIAWTRRTATIQSLIPVTVSNQVYVLEYDGITTTTLRLANSQQGYILTSDVPWGMDVISLTGTTVRVAWCGNHGETAASLVVADVDLATGAWTKSTVVAGVLVPVVQPTLTLSPLPGTKVGGQAGGLEMVARHSMTDDRGIVTPEWLRYFRRIEKFATSLPNLENATGTLPPAQGGTGGTGGLNPVDGHNINDGSIPLGKLEAQPWRWIEPGGFEDGGGSGDDGPPGKDGAVGPPGTTGATGAVGPLGGAWDGEPGDDGWPVPGTAGAAGAAGATGAIGPLGGAWDGEPGDDGWPVPGPTGPTGASGSAGTIGRDGSPGQDGIDGDDGFPVPGVAGAAGSAGAAGTAGPPGNDGADGEDSYTFPGSSAMTSQQVAALGYWSELTDGDATQAELIYSLGSTIDVWKPTA